MSSCQVLSEMGMTAEVQTLAADTLRVAPGDPTVARFLSAPPGAPNKTPPNPALTSAAEGAVKRNPTPENYVALSLADYQAGRYQDCIDAARRAVVLRPNYPEAWNNIAAAYEAMSQWDAAIQAASTALKIKSDFQLAKNNLAYALRQRQLASKPGQ